MENNQFSIVFDGNDILPKHVKHNDLIDLLDNLNKCFVSMLPEDSKEFDLRISSIQEGSLAINLFSPETSISPLPFIDEALNKIIRQKDKNALTNDGWKIFGKIVDFLNKYQCAMKYFSKDQNLELDSQELILESDFIIPKPLLLKEKTSFYAIINRVGNKKPTSMIELLPSGQVIKAFIDNKEIAIEIGKHLYETVILEGTITWNIDTYKAECISIDNFVKPFKGNAKEGLRILKEIAGPHWNKIDDPDKYLRSLRE